MDRSEAQALLRVQLADYRSRSYGRLTELVGAQERAEMIGPSGQPYQCVVNIMWDDKPGGNVRVLGSVDDGTFRNAVLPMTDDFIMAPDGSFVGEPDRPT
jgi:hypothetical protein